MRSARDWEKDAEQRPAWTIAKAAIIGTLIVLVCVALVGILTTGSIFFRGEAAKRTVNERTNLKVFTPENKIAQIAFFHDACQTVNQQLRVVENNQARLEVDQKNAAFAKDPVRQQVAIKSIETDQQDVTGAKNALVGTVATYNSRSRQSTADVFKDGGLPDQISIPADVPAGYTINCG